MIIVPLWYLCLICSSGWILFNKKRQPNENITICIGYSFLLYTKFLVKLFANWRPIWGNKDKFGTDILICAEISNRLWIFLSFLHQYIRLYFNTTTWQVYIICTECSIFSSVERKNSKKTMEDEKKKDQDLL